MICHTNRLFMTRHANGRLVLRYPCHNAGHVLVALGEQRLNIFLAQDCTVCYDGKRNLHIASLPSSHFVVVAHHRHVHLLISHRRLRGHDGRDGVPIERRGALWSRNHGHREAASTPTADSCIPRGHELGEATVSPETRHPPPPLHPALGDARFLVVAPEPQLVVDVHGAVPGTLQLERNLHHKG